MSSIHGLYAITPDGASTPELLARTRLALLGGATVVQYRNKSADHALRLEQAGALRELTREFSVPLIVNDDVLLAAQVAADGVHLGAADASLDSARAVLGTRKIIGVSCYNLPPQARAAAAAGADYVAFGAFFSSSVKPEAATAELGMLRAMRAELSVPIVAIGGITAANGRELVEAGADALAVISALFGAPDVQAAAQELAGLFIRDAANDLT